MGLENMNLSHEFTGAAAQNDDTYHKYTVMSYAAEGGVKIGAQGMAFQCGAKLDTGATTTSMHADNIKYNDATHTVSFDVAGQRFEDHPVSRMVKIKNRSAEGDGFDLRPVIKVDVSLDGENYVKTEVNLNNRASFSKPLLVGRNTLDALGIVVSSDKPEHGEPQNSACFAPSLSYAS